MPRNYTILGQRNPSANVLTNLYTVPASNSAVISSFVITNLDANAAAFSIAANTSGVATTNAKLSEPNALEDLFLMGGL